MIDKSSESDIKIVVEKQVSSENIYIHFDITPDDG